MNPGQALALVIVVLEVALFVMPDSPLRATRDIERASLLTGRRLGLA